MAVPKLDAQKRRTIKVLGAAPLLSVPLVGAASELAGLDAFGVSQAEFTALKLPAAKPRTSMSVEIQIINSAMVPENSVLIRNTTNEQILITRFMPGSIIFNNLHIDLNKAIGASGLVLSSGHSKAFLCDIAPAKGFRDVEYVWADHAVESLGEHASVITLGAFMANTDAVVFANTKQYIPQRIPS